MLQVKISPLLLLLLAVTALSAQVKIGDNPESLDNSAVLELESTSKGLLIPRMTTAQRTAIISPAIGLMVFDTDLDKFMVNKANGTHDWDRIFDSGNFSFEDADGDTKIELDQVADDDKIRFDTRGAERMIIDEQGRVGIGTTSPAAALEISSTTTGLLPPRMTTAQKETISSPVAGMLLFDSDLACLSIFDGTDWGCICDGAGSGPGGGGGGTGTSDNPGRSCKDILDNGGSTGDGTYWIDPDEDGTAFECYCDMTTDGGGWTLIGRGREGWAWNNAGKLISEVHRNIGTTSAFIPAYYRASVVDDIMGKAPSTLTDGFRIKRNAYNVTNGSAYQEVRWYFSSATSWSWRFASTIALSRVTIDGVNVYSTMTDVSTKDSNWRTNGNNQTRIFTWGWGSHNSIKGFSYGSSVGLGTNSSTNFLWEYGSENHSIPYTEVYVRE